jgi:hypothetical protein
MLETLDCLIVSRLSLIKPFFSIVEGYTWNVLVQKWLPSFVQHMEGENVEKTRGKHPRARNI